ncbi:hypothetical protein ACU610_09945 [Geodermatophilus sp. URMC 61]|uniref:hypothetical protein n=1 Tax=Geodermatophilus sp. URMC 61 TaxID=3423411 RepID=UPI00406CE84E
MKWAAVVVLGFVLEVGAVIWLARSNTARWERDHRAARAAIRAREEAGLRVRAAALMAQRVRHPHLTQLPHVHLPPRVVDRLANARGTLHRPILHLPLLHLPLLHLTRRRPEVQEERVPGQEERVPEQEARVPAQEQRVPAQEAQEAPVPAPDDAGTPSEEQPTS